MKAPAQAVSEQRPPSLYDQPLAVGVLWRTFRSLGKYKHLVFLGSLLCFICVSADMAVIHEIQKIVDAVKTHLEAGTIGTISVGSLVAMLLLYSVINRVTAVSHWLVTNYATNRALANLRMQFFEKLQSLSRNFYDQHKVGWLVARNTGDMQVIWRFMTFSLMMLMVFLAAVGSATVQMFRITPILLAPCLVIVPIMLRIVYRYRREMSRAQRETRRQNSRLVANMAESIRGIRIVHAFNREERNLEEFSELNRTSYDLEIHVAHLNGLFLPSLDLIGVLNLTLVIAFGSYLVGIGYPTAAGVPLSTGNLVAYILYMNAILWPFRATLEIYAVALGASAGAERLFEIIDMEPAVKDAPDAIPCEKVEGRVVFSDVSFRYNLAPVRHPGDEWEYQIEAHAKRKAAAALGVGEEEAPVYGPWVLRHLHLEIEPGQNVAIVGETGSGKTTMASLIARFYDPLEGRILIDGTDLRRFTQESLHRKMGIVLQQGYLFSGTVIENIRFGRPEASREEIKVLARQLGTEPCIRSLPDGFDTVVLEGGENLSLGQRQLIAITRAVAADPRILILDEPTSSLDVYTERILQKALDTLVKGRTTIVIAHRLSTVRNADRILVVDKGEIVEDGAHEELLAKKGRYHHLATRAAPENGEAALLLGPLDEPHA
ncbi:MAG: ABC transporter ATP-binding protein [Planctomycetota bacterium]